MKKFDDAFKKCKVCGSDSIHELHTTSDGIKIFRCDHCLTEFMNPQYSDEYLADYYSSYGEIKYEIDDKMNNFLNYYLNIIETLIPGRKLLDVGCGNGFILRVGKERGWNVVGYDVDPVLTKTIGEKIGINILSGDFAKLDFPASPFNTISMIHVIEHLKDPLVYLTKIKKLLDKEGILFLALPNIASISARTKFVLEKLKIKRKNVGSYYDASHHIFYYSPKSIKYLLSNQGFEALNIWRCHDLPKHPSRFRKYLWQNVFDKIKWNSSFAVIARKIS